MSQKGRSGSTAKRKTGPTAAEARAAAQAAAKAGRGARSAALTEHFAAGTPGMAMLRFAVVSTSVFVVVTALAAIVDTRGLRVTAALVDVALFLIGCVVFLVALYQGAQRSRDAAMTMSGWWFLSDSAPPAVRTLLLGNVAVQVIVAVVAASLRFQTLLAFGILVPTLGLALCGWWSARYGMFPKRVEA